MTEKESKKESSFIGFREYFKQMASLVESNIKSSQVILREFQRFQDLCTFMDKYSIKKKK